MCSAEPAVNIIWIKRQDGEPSFVYGLLVLFHSNKTEKTRNDERKQRRPAVWDQVAVVSPLSLLRWRRRSPCLTSVPMGTGPTSHFHIRCRSDYRIVPILSISSLYPSSPIGNNSIAFSFFFYPSSLLFSFLWLGFSCFLLFLFVSLISYCSRSLGLGWRGRDVVQREERQRRKRVDQERWRTDKTDRENQPETRSLLSIGSSLSRWLPSRSVYRPSQVDDGGRLRAVAAKRRKRDVKTPRQKDLKAAQRPRPKTTKTTEEDETRFHWLLSLDGVLNSRRERAIPSLATTTATGNIENYTLKGI